MHAKKWGCICLAIVLCAAIIGCSEQDFQFEDVLVQLKWKHQAQFAGFYLAQQKNIYEKEKINAQLLPRAPELSNKMIASRLVEGKIQFAVMGGDAFLNLRSEGIPIVCIAVIVQRSPYVYAALKSSNIRRPRDLIGKKLMIPPDGIVQHHTLINKLGIDPDSMTYLPYTRKKNLLASGLIDAQLVYRMGTGLSLEHAGLDLDFIWMEDYGIRFYADTIVTSQKLIDEKSQLVEAFLRGSLKGWQLAIENPGQALKSVLFHDPGLSPELQLKMLKIQTPLIHSGDTYIGWMKPDVWVGMQTILGIENQQADIQTAVNLYFLEKIYGQPK